MSIGAARAANLEREFVQAGVQDLRWNRPLGRRCPFPQFPRAFAPAIHHERERGSGRLWITQRIGLEQHSHAARVLDGDDEHTAIGRPPERTAIVASLNGMPPISELNFATVGQNDQLRTTRRPACFAPKRVAADDRPVGCVLIDQAEASTAPVPAPRSSANVSCSPWSLDGFPCG